MNESNAVKQNIMRRIYFIYTLKRVSHVFAVRFGLLAALVSVGSFSVSVPNVLKNMPSLLQISKFFEFSFYAFLNTKLVIQLIVAGSVVVLFYLTRDVLKIVRNNRSVAVV